MRLIDADNVINVLSIFNDKKHGNRHFIYGIESAKEIINNQKTINVTTNKKGEWIEIVCPWGGSDGEYQCSYCKSTGHITKTKYCPYCGAKMNV